ncbi:MAG: glycosyltransferase, partial [Candidatus Omnitrophota bacterium]
MIREKETVLNQIYSGHGWRFLARYFKIRDRIFPFNTKRRLFAKAVFRVLLREVSFSQVLKKDNIESFLYYLKNAESSVLEKKVEKRIFNRKIKIHCDKSLIISNIVEMEGWAIARTRVEKVEVYHNGILLGKASYGHPRPDIQKAFPQVRNSLNSGFVLYATAKKEFSPGSYTLIVKASSRDGQYAEIAENIRVFDQVPAYLSKTASSVGGLKWMQRMSAKFPSKPRVIFVLPMMQTNLDITISSIVDQSYPFWDILLFSQNEMPRDIIDAIRPLVDDNRLKIYNAYKVNEVLGSYDHGFICFINPGCSLMPNALFEFASKINESPDIDLIYTDEIIKKESKKEFFFKPNWSPELLTGMNYIGQAFLLKTKIFNQAGGVRFGCSPESVYDLLLRVTEHTSSIAHLPSVLFVNEHTDESQPKKVRTIIKEAMMRRGIQAEVFSIGQGTFRARRKNLQDALVSIIIPTAYRDPTKFESCIHSIVKNSSFKNYEILIVDNSFGELPWERIKEIIPESIPHLYIKYDEPFNFSRMNNIAAERAEGDYLIFLNDDTEVISSDWIEAMLEQAQVPGVGVVGAKLLFPDGKIQHGGVFLVDHGGAGRHAFRYFSDSMNYWNGLSGVVRNCSAVTFACAMVSKEVFFSLGGIDEKLEIECNDVDFCLRALMASYRIVWTPFAVLYHNELTSRRSINTQGNILCHWSRWGHLLKRGDPFYNPNLSLDSDNPSLNMRPILIEHHEPFLQEGETFEYYKFTDIKEKVNRILIIKLDHIGDFILSLPAVKMVRAKFPEAHITMLVGKWAEIIAKTVPEIDHVLTFEFFHEKSENGTCVSNKKKKRLQWILQKSRFDLALDFRRHGETRKILKLSGARYTVGYHTCPDY